MSPGSKTPVLIASAPASSVPTITGVPFARPVSFAAFAVTPPATSIVFITVANWSVLQIGLQVSGFGFPSESYKGLNDANPKNLSTVNSSVNFAVM